MPKDKSGKKMTLKEDLAKPKIYAWHNNSGVPSHVYMLKQPNGKLAVYSSVDIKLWKVNQTPEQAIEFILKKYGGLHTVVTTQAHHVASNKFAMAYPGVTLTYQEAKERVAKYRLMQRIDKLDLRQIRALTNALHPKKVERAMEEREHRKSNHRRPKIKRLEDRPGNKIAGKNMHDARMAEKASHIVDAEPLTLKKKKKKRA